MKYNQGELTSIAHLAPITDVVVTPTDSVLSVSYDGALCEWDIRSDGIVGRSRRCLHSKGVNCVAVDPTGKFVATGGSDGRACLVDLKNDKAHIRVLHHPGDVETVVFSSQGEYLLTGGTDGTARIFDTRTGKQLFLIHHGKTVGASCRHPEEAYVVTGCNDNGVRKIEWTTGRIVQESKRHTGPVKALVPTKHGIVSSGHDTRILLFDNELNVLGQITEFSTTPKSMAVEPDGYHFWIAAYDQTITRWKSGVLEQSNGNRCDPVHQIYDARVWSHGIAVSSDLIAIGSFDGVPRCYRRSDNNDYSLVPAPDALVDCVSSMVLDHAAGCLILGGDSGTIRKVSTSNLKLDTQQQVPNPTLVTITPQYGNEYIPEQERHEWVPKLVTTAPSAITGIQGTSDDVIYGCWDGSLMRFADGEIKWAAQWHRQSGTMTHADSPIVGIAKSAEYVLAGLYTSGIACFRAVNGEFMWNQLEATGAIKSVSASHELFAMTGRYDPLRVGSLVSGDILARLALDTPVSDVVEFSPDGTRLAVCAADFQVWIVDIVKASSPIKIELSVIHRGEGHTSPIKAIAWLDSETVVSGCYNGHLYIHRVGWPSIRISQVDSRLGISAIAVDTDRMYWATFDGYVGCCLRKSFVYSAIISL
ncbi:MAG: hypothetical protein CL608_04600 [Anaerolineaceae bacterium]|nr:hypothetical protein [Anaerolineaceae bacterium]